MKLLASITDEDWAIIEPYVDCEFANPLPDEFVFYDPSPILQWRLAFLGIEIWQDNH
jgi:hypothetical protein